MTNITFDTDFTKIYEKMDGAQKRRGRYMLANQMLSDMNSFVPKQEGNLRTAVSVSLDGSEIYYHMPYAKKQYTQQHFKYTTPGTGPHWDKKAKGMYMKIWEATYVKGAGF